LETICFRLNYSDYTEETDVDPSNNTSNLNSLRPSVAAVGVPHYGQDIQADRHKLRYQDGIEEYGERDESDIECERPASWWGLRSPF